MSNETKVRGPVDVRGILERAGADADAPDGSQAWALAQVDVAVAELIEAAKAVVDFTPEAQREKWPCHSGITTAAGCGRCSRDLRLAAALANVGGAK